MDDREDPGGAGDLQTLSEQCNTSLAPAPLLPSTIKSMRPQFYDQYMDLVAWYRADGFGIYDDTPELDRALVLCDQYYGDWSSLVWLAQKIGKPIAIQSKDDHLDELLQKLAGESDDA